MNVIIRIILFSMFILFSGCFGGFPATEEGGKIEGYVRDILSSEPVDLATVKVQDVQYITTADGHFPLVRGGENPYIIPNGSGDSYSVRKDNYYNKTGTSLFSYGQKNLITYITPKPDSGKKYFISGQVSSGDETLEGATIVVNGTFADESYFEKTDSNKNYLIEIPASTVNVYVFKDGYEAQSKVLDLEDDMTMNFDLIEKESVKYGTIKGQIVGFNEESCGNSVITMGQRNSNKYQFVMASTEGHYTIYGVPAGEVQISVRAPGFYKESAASGNLVTVAEGETVYKNIKMEYISGE